MEETKKCPFCGKEILAVAKKCKHCGNWIDGTNQPVSKQSNEKSGTKITIMIVAIILIVLLALLLLFFSIYCTNIYD